MRSLIRTMIRAQIARAALGALDDLLKRRARPNRWKGLALGAAGGVAGTLAMGAYFKLAAALMGGQSGDQPKEEQEKGGQPLDNIALIGTHYQQGETSTETVGRLVYTALAGAPPRAKETKTALSQEVHWAFGAAMGALYGAARADAGMPDAGGGAIFGMAVWLLASELALPLLGLTPGPTAQPAEHHANYGVAHLVYGVTAAATTQGLRRIV